LAQDLAIAACSTEVGTKEAKVTPGAAAPRSMNVMRGEPSGDVRRPLLVRGFNTSQGCPVEESIAVRSVVILSLPWWALRVAEDHGGCGSTSSCTSPALRAP
jgi:hypothetical protein